MHEKQCTKCRERKPLTEFFKQAASKDGLQWYCKRCTRAMLRARNQTVQGKAWWRARQQSPRYKAFAAKYRHHYNQKPNVRAFYRRRAVAKLKARPPWVVEADLNIIYARRDELVLQAGIPCVVDHFWPLRGKGFSGLDAPWNLRVITESENAAKAAKRPDQFYSPHEFKRILRQLNG